MYDSFDMACHDENTALRLNIKVNSENLLPSQQKYNLGSLRLPADPSWPKIPQRRLSNGVGDLIEPTCTVNGTTGMPQPSQPVVRIPQFQSAKLGAMKDLGNFDCQHYAQKHPNEQSHQPRRKSGCTDPRFKKVTTVKSQMTSTNTRDKEIDEQININSPTITASGNCKLEDKDHPLWKDGDRPQVVLQQKAEKPDENCKGTETVGVQTMCTEITDSLNESVVSGAELGEQKLVEIQGPSLENYTRDQSKSETPVLITSLENETPKNVENNIPKIPLDGVFKNPSVQCCPGKDGQIFLKVEKKIQVTSSGNVQDITYSPEGKCMTQCYNVQVPVLSYQNVPVQISAQPQSTVDIPPQFPYSPASNFQSALPFDNMIIPRLELSSDSMPQFSNLSMNFETKKVENTDKNTTSLIQQCKDPILKGPTQTNKSDGHNHQSSPKKLLKDIQCSPQQNFSNISKDILPKHNFHIYCHQENPCQGLTTDLRENKQSIQPKLDITYFRDDGDCIYKECRITDTESQFSDNVTRESTPILSSRRDKNYNRPIDRVIANFSSRIDDQKDKKIQPAEYKTAYFEKNTTVLESDSKYKTVMPTHDQAKDIPKRQKRKMKLGFHSTLNRRRVQSSEPQISIRTGRKPRTPHLKKARSYLSKSTHQLTPDSESNYPPIPQQYQLTSGHEQNVNNIEKTSNIKVKSHPRNLNGHKKEHCIKPYQRQPQKSAQITSSLDFKKRVISPLRSPRADTDIIIQKPTSIPVTTQELLNKNYWEYYNKMKDDKSLQQRYFCQVAMGAPQSKNKKSPELSRNQSNDNSPLGNQMELSPPEIRTLKQCSVLSTMINKTLDLTLQPSSDTIGTKQIYMNGNMRSSSDPTAGTLSAILKKLFPVENEDSIISSTIPYNHKPRQNKHNTSRTSRLKSIREHQVVFFGCMMCALIVFLPKIYQYIFYEEHDEYEETSYVDTVFEYIVVSFKEGCGEFFDVMNKIFFKPDARMQRLSSGRWRQKISKQHLI